jgi:hypothetical protein
MNRENKVEFKHRTLNLVFEVTRFIPLQNDTSQIVSWPSLCPSAEIEGLILQTLVRG